MGRSTLACALVLLGCAQTTPSPTATSAGLKAPPSPAVAASSPPTRSDRIRRAAEACGAAVVAGNAEAVADCMPSDAVRLSGGRARIIAEFTKGTAEMAQEGGRITGAEIDEPRDFVREGIHSFAIVPQRVTTTVKEGRLVQNGYLLAVSDDDGQTWKFLDGAGLTPRNLMRIYPSFPKSITLPALQKPELVPQR